MFQRTLHVSKKDMYASVAFLHAAALPDNSFVPIHSSGDAHHLLAGPKLK